MSSFSGFSIICPGKNLFFLYVGDNIWSSAHTLGPILIRNTPKCSKLNCRQFDYIFIKIYSTLSRNFFKKRVRAGETVAARPPPQPQKIFGRSILLAVQFPTRISKNFYSSYYNARDLAIFKTSTIKKNFFQKIIDLKMSSFSTPPPTIKGLIKKYSNC